jgi:hypothetical protein
MPVCQILGTSGYLVAPEGDEYKAQSRYDWMHSRIKKRSKCLPLTTPSLIADIAMEVAEALSKTFATHPRSHLLVLDALSLQRPELLKLRVVRAAPNCRGYI